MATMIYRICDLPSTNPSPILDNNRNLLNKLCLKSVIEAYKDVEDLKIHFIIDNCEYDWVTWLDENLEGATSAVETHLGIDETYKKSLEMALDIRDYVYIFQECDYLYRGFGSDLIKAAIAFGYASPYDHPDKYPGDTMITLQGNQHWRQAPSTTMTFATTRENLEVHYDNLTKYGYLDKQMWENLPAQLWTPIPSIATHMVKDYLAPGIDWKEVWSRFL